MQYRPDRFFPARRPFTAEERGEIARTLGAREETVCSYCGKEVSFAGMDRLHIDHKRPVCRGGKYEMANYAIACRECNLAKNRMTSEEFVIVREIENLLAKGFHPEGGSVADLNARLLDERAKALEIEAAELRELAAKWRGYPISAVAASLAS